MHDWKVLNKLTVGYLVAIEVPCDVSCDMSMAFQDWYSRNKYLQQSHRRVVGNG